MIIARNYPHLMLKKCPEMHAYCFSPFKTGTIKFHNRK